jgi:hypothetical protein
MTTIDDLTEAVSAVWLDMRSEDPQHADTPTDAVRWTRSTLSHDDVAVTGDDEVSAAYHAVLDASDDDLAEVLTDYR